MSLIVRPLEADLLRDCDTFTKMDPFVVVTLGLETKQSQVHNSGGKKPVWKDVLSFTSRDALLRVKVMDKDIVTDDVVGEGSFDVSGAYSHPNQPRTFPIDLFYEGKIAGKILVNVEFRQ